MKAQDGTELTYILNIGVTIPATSPSTSPTTPVVSTPGNNTGTTISTGIHSNINNPNTGIDTPAAKNRFIDIIGHWAENDINEMADKAIVVGVTDITFEPDRSITRAEFAALITRALKLSAANDDAVFADVASDAWDADEVAAAAGAGLISGYAGSFRPEDNITREEMAVVIMKAYVFLGKEPLKGKLDQFTDENQVSDWARQYAD